MRATRQPYAYQRFSDRGISVAWFGEEWRSELSEVFAHSAKQRAHADRQRDAARSMRDEAHAMQARARLQ